jgi:putative mycofactocin binding protein MftB
MLEEALLDEEWALDASVALRPESFGALAYHFGTRKLVFLKRPELVAVVRGLGAGARIRDALAGADVPESSWPTYVAALAGLADSRIIHRVEAASASGSAA